jgi:hypothetical protein
MKYYCPFIFLDYSLSYGTELVNKLSEFIFLKHKANPFLHSLGSGALQSPSLNRIFRQFFGKNKMELTKFFDIKRRFNATADARVLFCLIL